ncbi:beta lactamase [Xanthomonas fragariae LMG 25863]|nr:beta lactamase [Xanthomonas fragariae LMG 25863]
MVGDPAGLTAFLRRIGDTQTRSDRGEPEMNRFAEGDPCDTTTPAAMAATMRTLLLGDALRPASRKQLAEWMIDNRTGSGRVYGTCRPLPPGAACARRSLNAPRIVRGSRH